LAFEPKKQVYSGKIREVTLGLGDRSVTVGGRTAYAFHTFEGEMPHPPRVAMEVWDKDPGEDWPETAKAPFKEVLGDPAAWAKKCVESYGAEIIAVQTKSADPNAENKPAAEVAEVVYERAQRAVGATSVVGVDAQFEQRVGEALAVRIERERGRDAGVERALADELQRVEVRQLVAPHLAPHDVREMAPHRIRGDLRGEQRKVGLAQREERQRQRVALVARAGMGELMQLAFHGRAPGQ